MAGVPPGECDRQVYTGQVQGGEEEGGGRGRGEEGVMHTVQYILSWSIFINKEYMLNEPGSEKSYLYVFCPNTNVKNRT